MNDDRKVSVIIPVYNAEKYLRDTLNDAVGQTLREIEIICVDDGSTDGSAGIVEEYAAKDERVHLIRQKNQYAGMARNNGIAHAGGEYLMFWDADDRFDPALLEKMYTRVKQVQADICVCNANVLDEATGDLIRAESYLVPAYLQGAQEYSRETHPGYLFNIATNVPWNKLFRAKFVREHGLQFESRSRANDVYFVMMAFYLAKKIAVLDERLVTYRANNESSLTGTLSQTPFCAIEAFDAVRQKLAEYGGMDEPQIRQSFDNRVLQSLLFGLHKCVRGEAFQEMYQYLKTEGFARLGIFSKEDYYYSEEAYCRFCRMLQEEPLDYVLQYHQEEKIKKQIHIRDLKEKIRGLHGRVSELKDINKKIKEENKQMRTVLSSRCGRLAQKVYTFRKSSKEKSGRVNR